MKKRRVAPLSLSVCLMYAALLFQAVARAQDAAAPAASLSCTEMETFLKTAKVVSQKTYFSRRHRAVSRDAGQRDTPARSVDPNR